MATQFNPVRFFVLMALAAFIVCGAVAFRVSLLISVVEKNLERWFVGFALRVEKLDRF